MKNAWTLVLLLALPAAGFAREARGKAAPKGGVFSGGRMTGGASVHATGVRGSAPAAASVVHSQQTFGSRSAAAPMSRRSGFGRMRHSESPAPQDQTPPPWATPGALIRTEGLGFKEEPAAASRIHSVEAGDRVVMEESKSQSLTNRPGLFTGPKDTPPPPNAMSGGGASGRNAITPNAPGGSVSR